MSDDSPGQPRETLACVLVLLVSELSDCGAFRLLAVWKPCVKADDMLLCSVPKLLAYGFPRCQSG